MELSDRQERERDYHIEHAHKNNKLEKQPVSLDIIENSMRRPWNAYWSTYDLLLGLNLQGKKVLVPGCGFGEDAIRIAALGAIVYSFDLSPELLTIAKSRAKLMGINNINWGVMGCEKLSYEDNYFDFVFFNDILHHVDIEKTIAETKRVLAYTGCIIGNELYTHSWVQKNIRNSYFVKKVLYPAMQGFIYTSETPYITEDEHKIDETEFELVSTEIHKLDISYFNLFEGRLFPNRYVIGSKIDRIIIQTMMSLAKYFCGRIVFIGKINKN